MSTSDAVKDLVVLVADRNMEKAVSVLLQKRYRALGIKSISFDIFIHPQRDPGVYHQAGTFLRPYASQYRYALVLFDFTFAGAPADAQTAECHVQNDLDKNGWRRKSAVVVIDPELEIWVFSSSPHVIKELADGDADVFQKVIAKYGACPPRYAKPKQPKEAMEELLKTIRRPRSSAIYGKLAESVSLETCRDPSFAKLKGILQQWFA